MTLQPADDELTDLWDILSSRRPLPLRFALHSSRRANGALCPCLEVNLPPRKHTAGSGKALDRRTLTVSRILDPEHKTPYVSLSPILEAAGMSTVQGLLMLELNPRTDFDTSLAGLEPWDDLWVSLKLAARVSQDLSFFPQLSALLDTRSKSAWSLDEGRLGLSHNWRVPAKDLSPATYSTEALLKSSGFAKVEILKDGEQLKTLVSSEQRQQASVREDKTSKNKRAMRNKLICWSSMCYTAWHDVQCAKTALLQQSAEEPSDGTLQYAIELVHDLDVHQISPTIHNLLEWLQSECISSDAESDSSGRANHVLGDLNATQRLRLKELDRDQEQPNPAIQCEGHTVEADCLRLLEDLELQLRAKLGCLHRMQLFNERVGQGVHNIGETTASASDTPSPPLPVRSAVPASYQDLLDSIAHTIQISLQENHVTQVPLDRTEQGVMDRQGLQRVLEKLDDLAQRLTLLTPALMERPVADRGPDGNARPSSLGVSVTPSIGQVLTSFVTTTILIHASIALIAYIAVRRVAF